MTLVYTVVTGNNADLIAAVSGLYLTDGMIVADVTYGKGVFWRKMDTSRFTLLASDLSPHPKAGCSVTACDLGATPYGNASVDVVVLDPPYVHNPGSLLVDKNYQNKATTEGFYHDDIIDLYVRGMREARRILKNSGTLWVKCQDEVESGLQRWSVIDLHRQAAKIGLYAKDLFILVPPGRPTVQRQQQQHARRSHSYLWIFVLPDQSLRKKIAAAARKYRHGLWPSRGRSGGR